VHKRSVPRFGADFFCLKNCRRIASMLTAARLEKTNVIAKPTTIALNQLLAHCVNDYQALCTAKNMQLITTLPLEVARVSGDDPMLKLAISNLLSNAINFSSSGQTVQVNSVTRWRSQTALRAAV
jgi:signal transduction histidine kinase